MTKPLRIAIFTPSFLPKCSGAEIFHHNLATRLVDRGHHVSVVLPKRYLSELASFSVAPNYNLIPYPSNTWSYFKRSPRLALFVNRLALEHLQRRHHFDLWHGVVTYPTGICLVDWQRHAAQKNRYTPYVVRSVGDDILFSENKEVGLRHDPKVRNLIHTIMPKVRMMVALSETMRREYLELGVSAQNLAVIPNAVDIRRFQAGQDRTQTRQLHNLEADRFLFLAVGRNHPQKDYPTLLDAALKLQQISNIPFSLVIAGRNACGLRQQVNDRGLNHIVRLLEIGISKPALHDPAAFELPSNEMINLYRAADAFVMSSLLEGFSSALLEAMAAGLPVIVTDSPGCADFVREENSGCIVPPADPAALAETMSLILQSAATRSELSARSSRRASQFDWPVVVDRYLEVYHHVLGARPSPATLSSTVRRS